MGILDDLRMYASRGGYGMPWGQPSPQTQINSIR